MINLFHQIAAVRIVTRSIEAAVQQTGASRHAVQAVRDLMQDGLPRSDEEIAAAVRRPGGGRWSPDTARHARLALTIAGVLRWSGKVRDAVYGRPSCVWVLA